MLHQCMPSLKEPMAITALPIRKDTEIMGMSRHTVPRLERLVQECAILLATIYLPKEPPGSIQEP